MWWIKGVYAESQVGSGRGFLMVVARYSAESLAGLRKGSACGYSGVCAESSSSLRKVVACTGKRVSMLSLKRGSGRGQYLVGTV